MENYSWKQLHYTSAVQKTTNQIEHVPKTLKPGAFVPNLDPMELPQRQSYPSCRPIKHYRKTGTSHSNNTSTHYVTPTDCDHCTNFIRVGKTFKMLGKKDNGDIKNKACNGTPTSRGNVISFSGISNIRTGLLNKTKTTLGATLPGYYHNYSAYLKKRGHTYEANSTIHPIPGIDYSKAPEHSSKDSSHYYTNSIVECPTKPLRDANVYGVTIYKPNNPSFGQQGPVDSSSYIERQKYNAIVKNNASFLKTWKLRLSYTDNPIITMKNKFYTCTNC